MKTEEVHPSPAQWYTVVAGHAKNHFNTRYTWKSYPETLAEVHEKNIEKTRIIISVTTFL